MRERSMLMHLWTSSRERVSECLSFSSVARCCCCSFSRSSCSCTNSASLSSRAVRAASVALWLCRGTRTHHGRGYGHGQHG